MAKNRIWRTPPCDSYDVERLESWLQDMARDGWHLDKSADSWLGFFPFQQDTPREVRYRLEPKSKTHSDFTNAPEEEEEDLYKTYGWEFVMAHNLFYIYRTADPDARELNTDLSVHATALKAVKRNTRSIMFCQLWLVAFWVLRIWNERFRFLVTFGWFIVPVAVFLLITSLAIDAKRFLHIRRLQKQLKENIPLDHSKPWRKYARPHRVGKVVLVSAYALVITLLCSACSGAMVRSYEPTSTLEFPGNPPFVTASDILPDSTYRPEKFMDYNTYSRFSSSLAPDIIEWREYGTIRTADGKVVDGSLRIDYYETVSPILARGLVDDFLHHYEKYEELQFIDAPDIDVDHIVAFQYIFPTVLIQNDNIFICATVGLDYREEYLLEEWAQRMAEYLNN